MKEQSNSATLIVPNELAFSEVVGAYVKAMARKVGFDEEEQSMIELGVDEAFTNIVEHAFDPEEDATFDVICKRIPLGLQISLREKGLPFDPSRIPEYVPGKSLQEQSGKGLGFFLMKQTMDEVAFNNLGKQGKETQLIKFLKKKNVKDYFDESQLQQFEKPFERKKKKPKEKIDIIVRRMEGDEALEVSKCVYRTYGYSYGKEHAYYPERLVELNETGLMVSAVAATMTDEVAGHCALMKYEVSDPTAEIGMAVVKPKFRGQGCMNGMVSHLIDSAREDGLVGVYAHAVAIHPYSQKAMQSFGLHDCNILLANVPTTMSFKGISEELSQRDSHVVSFRYLNKPEDHIAYVPERHREMVQRLYQNTELDPEIRTECETEDIKFQENETVITSRVNVARGIAYVDVERSGADILTAVQTTLKDLLLKRMDAIYLYLSMQDPAICSVTTDIEKMGFFFAGIFPGKAMGDALVLQYLNNIRLDYSKISLASDMAKELCAYIKPFDPNQ